MLIESPNELPQPFHMGFPGQSPNILIAWPAWPAQPMQVIRLQNLKSAYCRVRSRYYCTLFCTMVKDSCTPILVIQNSAICSTLNSVLRIQAMFDISIWGQYCKFCKFPLSFNPQKRLGYKEHYTKYRHLS